MLKDKNIVIGVSGGIAVYKALDVVSRLRKLGANINIIMTKGSQEFVTPLSFQSLSQNYVVTHMFDEPRTWDVEHISLAQKADLFVIVPATANIIGKIANGIADDMLSTTVMATTAPVVISPAMNTNMYNNPIVQTNIKKLKRLGYIFIEPVSGRLACGDHGTGKLPDPETIVDSIKEFFVFKNKKSLKNKKVVITAGPTIEQIDPVRYITNHSTGKMGYEIAKAAKYRGAEVILISGPTDLNKPSDIKVININSAREMYQEILNNYEDADIIIKAAAVSDYRPKDISKQKIKKKDNDLMLELERNPDILYELGKLKNEKILVGFAAETENLLNNAKEKINKKNLDFIIANDLTSEDAGFKVDTNIVSIIDKYGNIEEYNIMKKSEVANIILDKVCDLLVKE